MKSCLAFGFSLRRRACLPSTAHPRLSLVAVDAGNGPRWLQILRRLAPIVIKACAKGCGSGCGGARDECWSKLQHAATRQIANRMRQANFLRAEYSIIQETYLSQEDARYTWPEMIQYRLDYYLSSSPFAKALLLLNSTFLVILLGSLLLSLTQVDICGDTVELLLLGPASSFLASRCFHCRVPCRLWAGFAARPRRWLLVVGCVV